MYRAIESEVPSAEVLVLGYPRFFPTRPPRTCPTGAGKVFVRSDMEWMNSVIARVNRIIKEEAERAGLDYVDTYDVFQGNELCTRNSYLNYADPIDQEHSYHPTVDGHEALASRVATSVTTSFPP